VVSLQVQDMHKKFLNSAKHRAYFVTTLLIIEQTLLNKMLYVLIMFRMLNYSSLFLYIHNYFEKEKYCYAYIFQNSVLYCVYIYTGCPRRKGPNFGRVFLRSNYTDI